MLHSCGPKPVTPLGPCWRDKNMGVDDDMPAAHTAPDTNSLTHFTPP